MRLIFTEPAARDLEHIIDYIALDNPSAAEKLYHAIVAATEQLKNFPKIGHVGRLSDTYELPVVSLPYVIVYQFGVDTVTILAVFHTSRDLARALKERKNELKQ